MGLLNLSETGLILKEVSIQRIKHEKATVPWDIPGSPVVKTSPSTAEGVGLISDWRAKIPYASSQKNKTCNRSNIVKNTIKTLKIIYINKNP